MTTKAAAAEVLVKLVIDSNAEKATEELKDGLGGAEKAHKKWHRGILDGKKVWGGFKGAAVGALSLTATAAMAMGAASIGAAIGAASAFEESERQVRSLAGAMTLLDQSDTGFSGMLDIAGGLKDELEDIAMVAGTTDDAMVAAFTNVIERGGKSIDQAKELVATMSQAGRAIPGGVEAISEAFEQIEMGVVRAKNPIVGMIAATHLLKGNAKQVAAQMMKMSPEEQMKLAEKAVASMGKKMKDVPLSMKEMATSAQVFIGNIAETAGLPIMKSVEPIFGRITGWLHDNQDMINDVAKNFGQTAALLVETAGPFVDESLKIAKEIGNELRAADGPIKELKSAFQYIYDNKDGLVSAFGTIVRTMLGGVKASVAVIEGTIKGFKWIVDSMSRMKNPLTGGALLGGGMAQSTAASDLKSAKEAATSGITPGAAGDVTKVSELGKDYVAAMVASGVDAKKAEADFASAIADANNVHYGTMKDAAAQRAAAQGGDAVAFAKAWDMAVATGDQAAQKYVASFLENSGMLQDALGRQGPAILESGFEKMIGALEGMGKGDIAKNIMAVQSKRAREATTIGKGPQVNQYFGSVTVHQDFKDEDPERVAVIFRNDLVKHGMARIQARGAIPGGS